MQVSLRQSEDPGNTLEFGPDCQLPGLLRGQEHEGGRGWEAGLDLCEWGHGVCMQSSGWCRLSILGSQIAVC